MAELKLPYILKEGTVAYAAKVMGDLNVIINFLNNISLDGATKTDLEISSPRSYRNGQFLY